MHIEQLIRMANDIGAFFASEEDPKEGANGIYSHIRRYWDPRMRKQIIAYCRDDGGTELSELARAAVVLLEQDETKSVAKNA
jgi:formate dehydrogenase subunit delta